MISSTINRFIGLFDDAFKALSATVPISDVERLAMLIHHSMDQGRRTYHTSTHVFDMSAGMNPRQVLATLFHDLVYYQLDGGFPHLADTMLKRVIRVEQDKLMLRPIEDGDTGLAICAGLFGFKAGQTLPLYGGMNEFLSAIAATRLLQPFLPLRDLVAIVACIEATVPFRGKDAHGRGPADALADRVRALNQSLAIGLSETEIGHMVADAVQLANRDVGSFAEADAGVFLSTTWLLIEESNAPLAAVGIYSIQDYRSALVRMERFLAALNPDHIFHRYLEKPAGTEFSSLCVAARRNIDFSCDYLGAKIAGIAVVEALALATGGNCPVSMFLGDIRSPYGKPDRIEDFLPSVPAVAQNIDAQLLNVLEKGRARETTSDLTSSPLTGYIYRFLGCEGTRLAVQQARQMFNADLPARAFLAGLNRQMVATVAQACAQIALSRRDALLALEQSL